jgi:hypothetical protein
MVLLMISEKQITEIEGEEFEAIIEAYIERESQSMGQNMGEIDAPLFYEALEEIFAAEPETVELEGHIVGSHLQLHPAAHDVPGVRVHDNEIMVNNIRFVIHLTPVES